MGEEGAAGRTEGRLEGLLFLQRQLSTHKDQLPTLVSHFKGTCGNDLGVSFGV